MCYDSDKQAETIAAAVVPRSTSSFVSPEWHAPTMYRKLPAGNRLVRVNTDFLRTKDAIWIAE